MHGLNKVYTETTKYSNTLKPVDEWSTIKTTFSDHFNVEATRKVFKDGQNLKVLDAEKVGSCGFSYALL